MTKSFWRKNHKWFGITFSLFFIAFGFSGLILNHPAWMGNMNIRRIADNKYSNWNNGLMRGTQRWNNQVLVYGNAGIWESDSTGSSFASMNAGLPKGMANKDVRRIVKTSHSLFALTPKAIYSYSDAKGWSETPFADSIEGRLSDMSARNDSLIITSRSTIHVSVPPYRNCEKLELSDPNVPFEPENLSLVHAVRSIHDGSIIGNMGSTLVDVLALVMMLLGLSGLLFWILTAIKSKHKRFQKSVLLTHRKAGVCSILFLAVIILSGWLLRAPFRPLLQSNKDSGKHVSRQTAGNPWKGKLMNLMYDEAQNDWILATTEGFFSMSKLKSQPRKIDNAPEVSRRDIVVQEQLADGTWLISSAGGLIVWNRKTNDIQKHTPRKEQPATTEHADNKGKAGENDNSRHGTEKNKEHARRVEVSGYSADFMQGTVIVDAHTGTDVIAMPKEMERLPMSFRSFCWQLHNGSIFEGLGLGTKYYIFVMGIAMSWTMFTGWKITRRKKKRRHIPQHHIGAA